MDTAFWRKMFTRLGPLGMVEFRTEGRVNGLLGSRKRSGKDTIYTLHARDLAYPVFVREGGSDRNVFSQIFLFGEYEIVRPLPDIRYVIDCGANVGYASALFLNFFPQAKILAVEPDPQNFVALERNMTPYKDRVACYEMGVWSKRVGLKLSEREEGGISDWGVMVREALPDETPDVPAIDIATLLAESGFPQIDLLKVDIEYSEKVVFAENFESWLSRTRNIVIELHDTECEKVFFAALEPYETEVHRSGEYTFCKILGPKQKK